MGDGAGLLETQDFPYVAAASAPILAGSLGRPRSSRLRCAEAAGRPEEEGAGALAGRNLLGLDASHHPADSAEALADKSRPGPIFAQCSVDEVGRDGSDPLAVQKGSERLADRKSSEGPTG